MKYKDMMRKKAQEARQKHWSIAAWKPSPGLATRTSDGISVARYVGQKYDPSKSQVIEDGWDHDHCLFCWRPICDWGDRDCEPEGFTDGKLWMCKFCYERVIVHGEDPIES
jgi:hypothetical protein